MFGQVLVSALKLLLLYYVCNCLLVLYQCAWTEQSLTRRFNFNCSVRRLNILFHVVPLLLFLQMNSDCVGHLLRQFERHNLAKFLLVRHFLEPNVID